MIGLSVSLCALDVALGKIPNDQVEKIIGGTRCSGPARWEIVIAGYREYEWEECPEEAERIVRQWLKEGKIFQPRLEDNNRFPVTRWGKKIRWVQSEEEIEWNQIRGGILI